MKTVLFQGDSITDCGRLTCGGAGYPMNEIGPGYAGLISSRLLWDHAGDELNFINRGISGNRIVDLYARWKADALNLNPDILSLLIGVNDVLHEVSRNNGVGIERYDEFLRRILAWSRERNPDLALVIMEPFILPFGYGNEEMVPEIKRRGEVVRQVATDFKAIFIPLQQPFEQAAERFGAEFMLVDGVHPTPAGHQMIADLWLKNTACLF